MCIFLNLILRNHFNLNFIGIKKTLWKFVLEFESVWIPPNLLYFIIKVLLINETTRVDVSLARCTYEREKYSKYDA